jgi:hypothetical protein
MELRGLSPPGPPDYVRRPGPGFPRASLCEHALARVGSPDLTTSGGFIVEKHALAPDRASRGGPRRSRGTCTGPGVAGGHALAPASKVC